jgi:hypothetical protein
MGLSRYKLNGGFTMNNWGQMYTGFTTLNKNFRYRVLRAIGDPNRRILHGQWTGVAPSEGNEGDDDCKDGCLFITAAAAAMRTNKLGEIGTGVANLALILGLTEDQVASGIKLWDSATDLQRFAFRERIREFVEQEYPVITFSEPETSTDIAAIQTSSSTAHTGAVISNLKHQLTGAAVGILAVCAMAVRAIHPSWLT